MSQAQPLLQLVEKIASSPAATKKMRRLAKQSTEAKTTFYLANEHQPFLASPGQVTVQYTTADTTWSEPIDLSSIGVHAGNFAPLPNYLGVYDTQFDNYTINIGNASLLIGANAIMTGIQNATAPTEAVENILDIATEFDDVAPVTTSVGIPHLAGGVREASSPYLSLLQVVLPTTGARSSADPTIRDAFVEASSGLDEEERLAEFSAEIESLARERGAEAVRAVARHVLAGSCDPTIGLAALRGLGQLGRRNARDERRLIAEEALRSPVPEYRFGALHVLGDTLDKAVLPALLEAVQRETIGSLRDDMVRLAQLIQDR